MRPLALVAIALSVAPIGAQPSRPAPRYYFPTSVVADSRGNVFVSGKQNKIIKVTPDGSASDFAGDPGGAVRHRDGVGLAARFEDTKDLAIDAHDNLYLIDNNKIRKITPDAVVTTLAGNDRSGFIDGTGSAASFKDPTYLAVGPDGRVYVNDHIEDSASVIRVISPTGVVTTRRQRDGDVMRLKAFGLAVEPTGALLECDYGRCVRRLELDNSWVTVAGQCGKREWNPVYKEGDVATAELMEPRRVVLSPDGAILLSDLRLNRVISIAHGRVATIAGNSKIDLGHGNIGGYSEAGWLDGPARQALFNSPEGIAFDPSGNLFIADTGNHCIRRLSPGGVVTTFSR